MKRGIPQRAKTALMVAVIAAIVTMGFLLLRPGEASPMQAAVSTVTNPLKSGMSAIVRRAQTLHQQIFDQELLEAENEQLRNALAEKNEDIRNAETYKEENKRLRELLSLSEKHTDYTFEIANVVSWDSSGYSSIMTISKGETAGIQTGMCAVTEDGQVVGVVTETGSSWASVTTILDTTSEIGGYIFGSGYTCIAEGDFELMREGQLRANYLSSTATVRNGDEVLTSGDGDLYPAGLYIGEVVDAATDESGAAKYAVLVPTADIASLKQVFLITSFDKND